MPQTYRNESAFYEANRAVYDTLINVEPSTYQKYMDWLTSYKSDAKILDVGCGVGYVANELAKRGFDAYGVDANRLAVAKASEGPAKFNFVSDYSLPFDDASFDVTGSYTVIEHIGNPELFLDEQARVLKPGGRLVVACPNFLKFAGIASHHPRTRGVSRKLLNMVELGKKALIWRLRHRHHFDMMAPVVRDHFEPDDDAIVVTNGVDVCAALVKRSLRIEYWSGTDRYFPAPMERISTWPLVRSIVGCVFIAARKDGRCY